MNKLLDEFKDTYDNACRENSYDGVINMIAYTESFIPKFFSNKGEAKSIHKLYESIEDDIYNKSEKTVSCVDVNKGFHIYREYVDGMIKFINDINNLNISTDSDKLKIFNEQKKEAEIRDSLFIESMYKEGNKINPYMDEPISEAVSNVEFLIDFIPELSTFKNECISMNENCKEDNSVKNKLYTESLDMMYKSISKYIYETVNSILTTYEDIVNDEETVDINESTDIDIDDTIHNYKLFI